MYWNLTTIPILWTTEYRLIETWDVLKFPSVLKVFGLSLSINRNMRCIEIRLG